MPHIPFFALQCAVQGPLMLEPVQAIREGAVERAHPHPPKHDFLTQNLAQEKSKF